MADSGLWKQEWRWVLSPKQHVLAAARGSRERLAFLVDRHWPAVSRGVLAVASLGPPAVFVVLWSIFVCITSLAWALSALLFLVHEARRQHGTSSKKAHVIWCYIQ